MYSSTKWHIFLHFNYYSVIALPFQLLEIVPRFIYIVILKVSL